MRRANRPTWSTSLIAHTVEKCPIIPYLGIGPERKKRPRAFEETRQVAKLYETISTGITNDMVEPLAEDGDELVDRRGWT